MNRLRELFRSLGRIRSKEERTDAYDAICTYAAPLRNAFMLPEENAIGIRRVPHCRDTHVREVKPSTVALSRAILDGYGQGGVLLRETTWIKPDHCAGCLIQPHTAGPVRTGDVLRQRSGNLWQFPLEMVHAGSNFDDSPDVIGSNQREDQAGEEDHRACPFKLAMLLV